LKTRLAAQTWMAFLAKATLRNVVVLGTALLPLTVARPAAAQSYSIIHTFGGLNETGGADPSAGLIADSAGNFYGTTPDGGILQDGDPFGDGIVYELMADGTEKVLYLFPGAPDGAHPTGGLIRDAAGNFYGTTVRGGGGSCYGAPGCGVVFRLSSQGTETILYTFTGRADGGIPVAGLVRDKAGNLYGTTAYGGRTGRSCLQVGCGVVFKLNPAGQLTVLHTFTGPPDGATPLAPLALDAAGNLYGTTELGGTGCRTYGCGTVFKLDPNGHETILYSFTGATDGGSPQAGVVLDAAGNLYGTTTNGGANLTCALGNTTGCGVVFKLDQTGNQTVLYTFPGGAAGAVPFAGLLRDPKGNLYGAAAAGGSFSGFYENGCGVVFKLSPSGFETVLHSFQLADGCGPLGSLLSYKGSLYGTAGGGASSVGVVFQLQP
jgi:uncharacterized repeat protein (TIGR03803 family)